MFIIITIDNNYSFTSRELFINLTKHIHIISANASIKKNFRNRKNLF